MSNLPNNPYVETMREVVKEMEDHGGSPDVSHEVFSTLANAYEVNLLARETRTANLQRERDYAINQRSPQLAMTLTKIIRERLGL